MNTVSFARNTINRIPASFPHVKRHLLHTFSRYQPLLDAYAPYIPIKDRHCLHQLELDWEQRKPLKDKTVLVNMHLTRITLALIIALLKSGARVEVTYRRN